ncbi:hypothetical protein C8F01DRAFT_1260915 [Mycena amicta]|nr:hypothetical protein C8F01DRAFT_1260915 [Mycena amicta]
MFTVHMMKTARNVLYFEQTAERPSLFELEFIRERPTLEFAHPLPFAKAGSCRDAECRTTAMAFDIRTVNYTDPDIELVVVGSCSHNPSNHPVVPNTAISGFSALEPPVYGSLMVLKLDRRSVRLRDNEEDRSVPRIKWPILDLTLEDESDCLVAIRQWKEQCRLLIRYNRLRVNLGLPTIPSHGPNQITDPKRLELCDTTFDAFQLDMLVVFRTSVDLAPPDDASPPPPESPDDNNNNWEALPPPVPYAMHCLTTLLNDDAMEE